MSDAPLNLDDLAPTQELMLDVLASRYRLGDPMWTFTTSLTRTARQLEAKQAVGWKSGVVERTIQVWLTEQAVGQLLLPGFESSHVRHWREQAEALAAENQRLTVLADRKQELCRDGGHLWWALNRTCCCGEKTFFQTPEQMFVGPGPQEPTDG